MSLKLMEALAELNNARQTIQGVEQGTNLYDCQDEDALRYGLDKLRKVAEMIDSVTHPRRPDVVIVIKGNDDGHVVYPPLRSSWADISAWTAHTVLAGVGLGDGVTIHLTGLEVEPVVLTVSNLIYSENLAPDQVILTVFPKGGGVEQTISFSNDGRMLDPFPGGFVPERDELLDGKLPGVVIPLDDDGRFMKRWPGGFCPERRKLQDGELL